MSATISAEGAASTTTTAAARAPRRSASAAPIPDAPPTTATRSPSSSWPSSSGSATGIDPAGTGGAEELDDGGGEVRVGLERHTAVSALLGGIAPVAAAQVEDRLPPPGSVARVHGRVDRRHERRRERPGGDGDGEHVVHAAAPFAERVGDEKVEVEVEDAPDVGGDAARLEQALAIALREERPHRHVERND